MKTLKTFLFVFALLVAFTACKKTDNDIQPSLSINPVQKELESGQGNFLVAVTSNVKWTASTDKSWLSLSPVSGTGDGTIQVDYQINTSATPRMAVITFKGSNLEDKYLTVTQLGVLPFLTVTPANQNVSAGPGNTTFAVSSNTTWVVSSDKPWCTLSQYSATGNVELIASYQENTLPNERIAKLTFTVPGLDDQYATVTQAAFVPSLFVSPSNQNVGSAAGSTTFSVAANIAWTATSNQGWCTINTGGTGNGTINVNFTENTSSNPRTDSIIVSGVGVSAQVVTIKQTGNTLTQGLVAYYPFNGNANDESGNGNHGIVNGASLSTDRKSIADKAYIFDGINRIEVSSSVINNLPNGCVSAWFYPSDIGIQSNQCIITKTALGVVDYFQIAQYGDKIMVRINEIAGSNHHFFYNQSIFPNSWYHLVVTWNGTFIKLFINGNLDSLLSDNSTVVSGEQVVYIGKNLIGKTDDIRIYNRALSETEIQQLYNE